MNISNERKKKITHSINSTREKKKKNTVVFTRSSTDLLVNSSLRLVTTQPIRGTIKRHFDKSYWILSLVSIIKDSSHLLNRRRVHVRAKKLKWRRREREREKKEKKNPSMIDRIEKAEWNIFHPFEKYKLQLGSKTLQLANQWPWKTPTSYNFPPPFVSCWPTWHNVWYFRSKSLQFRSWIVRERKLGANYKEFAWKMLRAFLG